MKLRAYLALLSLASPCLAHRLDEYLQATMVSIQKDQITASMRLIPGVAVSDGIIASVDSDHDGIFSPSEQQAYANVILSDLSILAGGQRLKPHLTSVSFPDPGDIRQGIGEIHIEFNANLPSGSAHRSIVFENRHKPQVSVYLMNCLAPGNNGVSILDQHRNATQSYYRIDYRLSDAGETRRASALSVFAGVPEMFCLGIRHIAQGTDHLLFLLALLVPAPLIAAHSRWCGSRGVRRTLLHLLRIVTAFTVGHSLTLALGASGLITVPEPPIEVLIAISILVSAAHAARPIFPGREPLIAGFFGLIHGLAFAASLHSLGVGPAQRVASLLGFNAGIETMQLMVVAAVLPSLIFLSRTSAYPAFRLTAALLTGAAALGWTVERISARNLHIDSVIGNLAASAPTIAAVLFACSFTIWYTQQSPSQRYVCAGRAAALSSNDDGPVIRSAPRL